MGGVEGEGAWSEINMGGGRRGKEEEEGGIGGGW